MASRRLKRQGWVVHHKRVHCLWCDEGLQQRQKRAWPADGSVRRHQAEHPYQVWAMDFHFVATAACRRLKFLKVLDEHSRLCLALRVSRRCKAKDVVAVLEKVASLYHVPAFIRSDLSPTLSGSGAIGAVQAPPTSNQQHRGRTALPIYSTAGSVMNPQHRAVTHGGGSLGLGN